MNSENVALNGHEIAMLIAAAKFEILAEWERVCRREVEAARVQTPLALRDSMPEFLDQLVETLRSPDPTAEADANAEVAREHAEDRATQPNYTLDQVIEEYHLLRVVIAKKIFGESRVDEKSRRRVHEFIDKGINKAAVRYIELEKSRHRLQTNEMQATRAEAERASAAKSAFLANMSHEIRSPLGAIMGFVGLLKDAGVSKDEVSNYLAIIDRNASHLLRIIDDILDLTKVESGKMVVEKIEFPLVEFMADFSSLAGLRARENGIIFEFKCESPLPEFIVTDPTRLRQILSNVVGNAIKFTEKGRVELHVTYEDNRLELTVRDTGRGISSEQREHLFQAFAQADSSTTRKYGGTGLGLILTKKLSEALGGEFKLVESKIGQGSTFEVVLPIAVSQGSKFVTSRNVELTTAKAADSDETNELRDLEVLLVEDSPDNQFLIQRILLKTGAKVTLANNGAEGVGAALQGHFDIVLMDIQMPVMDGHEAVRTLRQKDYPGPIVALTAHAMKEERERAIESGFSHFLTKPIDRKNLIELLRRFRKNKNLRI